LKLPVSVLVVVHTAEREVLLLQRAARSEFWQSVTGSLDRLDEPLAAAAARELREETGIDAAQGRLSRWNVAYTFEIYARWRHRFAPGVTHNTEHLFSLELARPAPVTIAPQEHTAFEWLPWREAASKCFSWSNRDAILMVGAALLAAGCATQDANLATPPRLATHLESGAIEVRECAHWIQALDAEIERAGVADAQYARVPGFPHLRVDRFHASLRARAAQNPSALRALVDRLAELDLESRRLEVQNLVALSSEARAQLLRRARDCSRLMRNADVAAPGARETLLGAARVPDDVSTARPWEKKAGFVASGNLPEAAARRVRYAPPAGLEPPRAVVAGLLERATFDPLGHPALSGRELDRLAVAYAPSFEVEIGGDRDRFGRMRWRRAADAPEVDAAEPAVYVQAAYTRYRERVLLQIVYTLWFDGPIDGVVWRVTLAPDGEPLVYDSIHPCGSFHVFFPTPRARLRRSPEIGEDWAVVPQSLPRVGEGERPVVTLASGTHQLEGVRLVRGADSLVRYDLRSYDELRSLARAGGQHAGIFNREGLIAGTPMRQWGRQATASGRHFDDADLLERRFEFDL
jgi:8-oxo-dGTP pyrophosphatase MutT (NUDIX family)